MDALARALVNAMAFIELSPEDVIDFDSSIQAMEMIVSELKDATPQEITSLKVALEAQHKIQKETGARGDILEFYKNFLESTGLEEK
ncbi:MAG: hypothetical protein OEV42_01210 [Deltaproteobacteria bacterium]|nr:hypothetical protein [Deltaproteobacteria bacterium]